MDAQCDYDEVFEIHDALETPTRALDFSDRINEESSRIRKMIVESSYVTELIVVNSALSNRDLVELLSKLGRLEKLNFTAASDHVDVLPIHKCLKRLHLETSPSPRPLKFVLDLMNACEAIEESHVHLIGGEDQTSDAQEQKLPSLAAERWGTLHTFVLSSYWSSSTAMRRAFLKKIFSRRPSMGVREWIQQNSKCFIYEHGSFNGADFVAHKANKGAVSLLRDYQSLNTDIDDGECPELHWGFPRSLREEGSLSVSTIFHLAKNLSPALVELDLTGTHGAYTPEVQIAVMSATRNLRTLALPACFFRSQEPGPTGLKLFEESRAREIFIKGNQHSSHCRAASCQCRRLKIPRCENCRKSLTSKNLPDFAALKNLRELTLNGAKMVESAYQKVGNAEVLTLRLCLSHSSDYLGLPKLLRRCPRLENLKVQGALMPIRSASLWKAFAACRGLKQLCVGTRTDESFPVPEIRKLLSKLSGQLTVVHLHNQQEPGKDLQQLAENYPRVLSVDSSGLCLLEGIRDVTGIPRIRGRALCCPESRVGMTNAETWKVK